MGPREPFKSKGVSPVSRDKNMKILLYIKRNTYR